MTTLYRFTTDSAILRNIRAMRESEKETVRIIKR